MIFHNLMIETKRNNENSTPFNKSRLKVINLNEKTETSKK